MDSPLPIPYEIGFAIDPGRKRKGGPNQDSLAILRPEGMMVSPPVLLIADGMGGHRGGALASQIITQSFIESYSRNSEGPFSLNSFSEKVISLSLNKMREKAREDPQFQNMGSTLVAVSLEGNTLYIVNIGDSRAYLIHGEEICQVSHDHSFVADAVRSGLLTPLQALNHPKKNMLTQSISARRDLVEPFHAAVSLDMEDVVLLCSDGLWGVVPETLLHAIATELPPQIAANKLVKLANSRGGPDNISVIIARKAGIQPRVSPADGDLVD